MCVCKLDKLINTTRRWLASLRRRVGAPAQSKTHNCNLIAFLRAALCACKRPPPRRKWIGGPTRRPPTLIATCARPRRRQSTREIEPSASVDNRGACEPISQSGRICARLLSLSISRRRRRRQVLGRLQIVPSSQIELGANSSRAVMGAAARTQPDINERPHRRARSRGRKTIGAIAAVCRLRRMLSARAGYTNE